MLSPCRFASQNEAAGAKHLANDTGDSSLSLSLSEAKDSE
jgi:hypothetical protein